MNTKRLSNSLKQTQIDQSSFTEVGLRVARRARAVEVIADTRSQKKRAYGLSSPIRLRRPLDVQYGMYSSDTLDFADRRLTGWFLYQGLLSMADDLYPLLVYAYICSSYEIRGWRKPRMEVRPRWVAIGSLISTYT